MSPLLFDQRNQVQGAQAKAGRTLSLQLPGLPAPVYGDDGNSAGQDTCSDGEVAPGDSDDPRQQPKA